MKQNMLSKEIILKQFEKRVFDESYPRIFKCLSMLTEEQLWFKPNNEIAAIGSLVMHVCGNARQWILSGLGGQLDNRNRDLEFKVHHNIKKSDLIFLLENLRVNLNQTLKELKEEDLIEIFTIQGFKESGFSVIIHVIEHFSYHTGQITTLTKLHTNLETGFYDGFNLNSLNNLN
ncbi:MAG: DUF1572 domain-containing protein [Bacteroidetes bacterium]|nr:DUF1572 domain-containing protein [Bacteroidota bacterium]